MSEAESNISDRKEAALGCILLLAIAFIGWLLAHFLNIPSQVWGLLAVLAFGGVTFFKSNGTRKAGIIMIAVATLFIYSNWKQAKKNEEIKQSRPIEHAFLGDEAVGVKETEDFTAPKSGFGITVILMLVAGVILVAVGGKKPAVATEENTSEAEAKPPDT